MKSETASLWEEGDGQDLLVSRSYAAIAGLKTLASAISDAFGTAAQNITNT